MRELLKKYISNKKVLILGFGREGRSTLKEILKAGGFESITIADMKEIKDELPEGIGTVTGDGYLDCIDDYDICFKSPGVVLKKPADEYGAYVTSEVDIFIEKYGDRIIGITGTKGKSTTSSLIAHALKYAGKDVVFGGNIGIPVFDIWESVKDESVIVLELSCHQLEYLRKPMHKAVLLNIYEDHLDHYGTREKYARAKMNIYLTQGPGDILYTMSEWAPKDGYRGEVKTVSISEAPFKDFSELEGCRLKGSHNVLNAAFAYLVVKEYGVSADTFKKAVSGFEGLPHRLQFIGNKNGTDYYDDSISTTVKSAESAVLSIENAAVLLLGGMERNLEYDELIDFVSSSRLKAVIFMYASGKRMYEMYMNKNTAGTGPKPVLVRDLKEAVEAAEGLAGEGDAVILSPAAASYDSFKNFEERGDVYKSLVF